MQLEVRLPLLIIRSSEKPWSFQNVKTLPVVYKSQRTAWMNCQIFTKWYDTNFIPGVKKHQKEIAKSGKVLLVIDNASSHPNAETLKRENGTV